MSNRTKTGFVLSLVLASLVGFAIYFSTPGRNGARAQVIEATGSFRLGSALGEERAGFSGRSKVLVFTDQAELGTLLPCLSSAEVEAQMAGFFVGVLVDEKAEPEVEAVFREREKIRVLVRGLQGQILGLLPAGFTCDDLVSLLASVRTASNGEVEKSPIYLNLLERPGEVVDLLLTEGKVEDALRFAGLLEEFEGRGSEVVRTVNSRLGK